MRFYRSKATLLSACALLFTPLSGQAQASEAPQKNKPAPAVPAQAATSGSREKLVVAMPKTYGKSETMSLWGDYFSHLSLDKFLRKTASFTLPMIEIQLLRMNSGIDQP